MNKWSKFLVILLFPIASLWGQEKEKEDLGVQEVLVVKSYTPSLSDAFKINSLPKLPDSLVSKQHELIYSLEEVPVVSTFQPNKASPLKLQQRKPTPPQNSLFSGAVGNKNQLYLNISSVVELDRTQRFGLHFYHDGFGSDLPNTLLKSNQQYSRFGLNHNFRSNDYNANTQLQFKNDRTNYFGLYDQAWDPLLLSSIDPEIKRNRIKMRTHWNWYDFILRSLTFQANLTSDNFNTSEQQLAVLSDFEIELERGKLKAEVHLEGFNTQFENSYFENSREEYSQGQGVLNLFWVYNRSDLKFKIGAGASYVFSNESLSSPLLYYPKIEILYKKAEGVISPYLTANGGVSFNTYVSLSEKNPYLAPATSLNPTFKKYNASLGVRSQLASVLNFDLGLVYDQIENFNFFQRLPFDSQNNFLPYKLSNAYEARYVDTDLYGLKAKVRIDLIKSNFIEFETRYHFYDPEASQTLWNIPQLEFNWDSQFRWKNQLVFSFNGVVWGNREFAERPIFINQNPLASQILPNNLPIFLRSTAHVTYKIAPQFDLFLKARFTSRGSQGRWAYYPEPPLLLLGGVTYKFDFQY